MRAFACLVVLLLAGPLVRAAPPTSAELTPDERRAIESIFTRWQQAWTDHDMHAFAQLFHEDGTWVVWTGRVWQGRKAIEDGHVEAHATFFRNSTQTSEPEEITRIAPDVVVARSITTLRGDSREPPAAVIYGRKLLVITRRDGAWKILYGQNTRLTPQVAATLGRGPAAAP